MNSIEISNILKKHYASRSFFGGVFASDQVPVFGTFPFSCVVNVDCSSEPGSHWISLYATREDKIEYFDSYALPPPKNVARYLMDFEHIYYSNVCLQDFGTDACGPFCIYFIINRSKGKSYAEIVNTLNKNLKNDEYVTRYVAKLYSRYK